MFHCVPGETKTLYEKPIMRAFNTTEIRTSYNQITSL